MFNKLILFILIILSTQNLFAHKRGGSINYGHLGLDYFMDFSNIICYISNPDESKLIDAVSNHNNLFIKKFFKTKKHISSSGCIIALFYAFIKNNRWAEEFLLDRPIVQNRLLKDFNIGVSLLYSLAKSYNRENILINIASYPEAYFNIFTFLLEK